MTEKEIGELARRVADAAAAADIVFDARCKLDFGDVVESDASDILLVAENAAQLAVESAVREYRAALKAVANCHKITTTEADEPTEKTG